MVVYLIPFFITMGESFSMDKSGEEIEKEVSSLRTMLTDSAVANEDLKAQINKVKEATMKIGKVLY